MATLTPRQRIMDAALELASEGGYEALQVRAITQRASVSSRTIYTHFPSLDSLLIVAVAERAGEELFAHLTEAPSRRRTAAARVQQVIEELNRVMTENRTLTVALLRALLSGKPDVAQHVRGFAEVTQAVLASAMRPDGTRAANRETAELLEMVYFSALIGWATGADDDDRVMAIMRRATLRVLPTR
jgi:AcrR family transcriptional regulator